MIDIQILNGYKYSEGSSAVKVLVIIFKTM